MYLLCVVIILYNFKGKFRQFSLKIHASFEDQIHFIWSNDILASDEIMLNKYPKKQLS